MLIMLVMAKTFIFFKGHFITNSLPSLTKNFPPALQVNKQPLALALTEILDGNHNRAPKLDGP